MPLYPNAIHAIRTNLELVSRRKKPPVITIGELTPSQLAAINRQRSEEDLPPVVAAVLFDGRHIHKSRCIENDYTIDDVLQMIERVFSEDATVKPGWATVLVSPQAHVNSEGRTVREEAVFECHGRLPYPELLSVVPRGDGKTKLKR